MLAAGGSIEPFWDILGAHKENQAVHNRLESYRIGNLLDEGGSNKSNDPYKYEPDRINKLIVKNNRPYVGETPVEMLCGDFITPTELFFVRNHLPVPHINISDYELEVIGNDVN